VNAANAAGAASPPVGDMIIFLIMAAWVAFFAILTITRRNPVTAVMSLVATFFGLAAIYAALSAHFLAVIQVLVYAGAIMVLFIFVVMILNREEVAPLSLRPMRLLGVVAGVYLTWMRPALFASGLVTNLDAAGIRRTVGEQDGWLRWHRTAVAWSDPLRLATLMTDTGLQIERMKIFDLSACVSTLQALRTAARVTRPLRRRPRPMVAESGPHDRGAADEHPALSRVQNILRYRVGAWLPRVGPSTALVIARPLEDVSQ